MSMHNRYLEESKLWLSGLNGLNSEMSNIEKVLYKNVNCILDTTILMVKTFSYIYIDKKEELRT